MNKTLYIIVSILTFGIYPLIIHSKAKKINNVNSNIQVSTKVDIDIPGFIALLGSKDNIVNIDATMSSLKVELKQPITFTNEDKNKFNIHGSLVNGNIYTFIFGDNANAIKEAIIKYN
jgi:phosphotransferase system IIB component